MTKKVFLMILDGWGIGPDPARSAIAQAQTPCMDRLFETYPNATLTTFGEDVGLPEGQMGNSEVGHLNIGAGRVVYQELQRINQAFKSKEIESNEAILNIIKYCNEHNKPLHLFGLVSDGGVHSHISHLEGLIDFFKENIQTEIYIHGITDGRDTDPKSGLKFITRVLKKCNGSKIKFASLSGRYYAMDRDKRWERVQFYYDLVVNGRGEKSTDLLNTILENYTNDITDEFIKPIISDHFKPISSGDAVFCFNFRTDRCREITQVLTQVDMPDFGMNTLDLHYTTMTRYDESYQHINVVFEKDNLVNTLGEILSQNNKTQVRIAETEKYPHVTFFFNGGHEAPYTGESRLMIPSPKVATYDLQPEMSAIEIKNAIIPEMINHSPDFVCLNFANTDMVGHTGVFAAGIKAAETVDACVEEIVKIGLEKGYSFIIIADHGNADYMINDDGSPNTAHTVNPVPIIIIDKDVTSVASGKLGDIAPTILKIMGVECPKEMNGNVLV